VDIGRWRVIGRKCTRSGRSLDSESNICSMLGYGKLTPALSRRDAKALARNLPSRNYRSG
jgi:hypothetical protein